MPLVDLLVAAPAAGSPAATSERWQVPNSCPRYRATAGSDRCQHYVPVGGCELLDIVTCSVWNGGPASAAPTGLVARSCEAAGPPATASTSNGQLALAEGWAATPPPPPLPARDHQQRASQETPSAGITASSEQLIGLRPEDLTSFKALHVEVCLHSPTLGDVWLVPAYTNERRREITPEHAATLATIVHAFPGATPSQWITRSR